jgi:hypothetical protein
MLWNVVERKRRRSFQFITIKFQFFRKFATCPAISGRSVKSALRVTRRLPALSAAAVSPFALRSGTILAMSVPE